MRAHFCRRLPRSDTTLKNRAKTRDNRLNVIGRHYLSLTILRFGNLASDFQNCIRKIT